MKVALRFCVPERASWRCRSVAVDGGGSPCGAGSLNHAALKCIHSGVEIIETAVQEQEMRLPCYSTAYDTTATF